MPSAIPLRSPAHETTAGFLISSAIDRATDRIEKVIRQAHGIEDLAEKNGELETERDNLQTEMAQLRSENEELRALMDETSDVASQEEELPQEDASQEAAPSQADVVVPNQLLEEPKTETPDEGGPVEQPEG